MNDIQTLMQSANPVPDAQQEFTDGDVKALLTLTLTRSGEMDVKEIMTPVEPNKPKWSGWLVAAASFGVVVLVAGLALLLTRSTTEELPPATTPTTVAVDAAPTIPPSTSPTTTQPAESESPDMTEAQAAFIETFGTVANGPDIAAFAELFDPGAVRVHSDASELTFSLARMLEEAENLWNQESIITLSECKASPTAVTCLTSRTGPVEDAFFGSPFESRNVYSLSNGGKIVGIVVGVTSFDGRTDQAFREWLIATHPEVAVNLAPSSERGLFGAFAWDDSEIYLEWAPIWAELGQPAP